MATNKFPARVLLCVLTTSLLPLVCSSATSQTDGKPVRHFRSKRQQCQDGTYDFNGRTCCLCGIGLYLEKNCFAQPSDRICTSCPIGTYRHEPNNQKNCEPCRSCDQPNANLEVKELCTPGMNTICQCKKDHYCDNPEIKPCLLCHPCKVCGEEGVKTPCTFTSNTVCNNEPGEGSQTATGVAIGVVVVVILALAGFVVFWKRRQKTKRHDIEDDAPTPADEELLLKELHPYLPEIAKEIGWKDMKGIAMNSMISPAVIEGCQLDHPGDSQEQTLKLLGIWVEKEGRDAAKKLIQTLNKLDKKNKAQKVKDILKRGTTARSNVSV